MLYYSHNEAFWRKQGRLPSWSKRGLRAGSGKWLGVYGGYGLDLASEFSCMELVYMV